MKKKIKLDVVVIATLRPEILDITLNSFYHRLLKNYNVRLIVNIDPVGEPGVTKQEVIKVCKRYFKNTLINTPKIPSFSRAVYWCWKEVKTDIFFHLEDDWCLVSNVNNAAALKPFSDKNVIQVRLNSTRNNKFKFNDGFALAEVFSLNPSFFRKKYIKEKLPKFSFYRDPEKQIRYNLISHSFSNPRLVLYGHQNQKHMIIMTGRFWREKYNFNKWVVSAQGNVIWGKKKLSCVSQLYANSKYYFYLCFWKIRYYRFF